jgi:hypothetical protein
MWCGDELVRIRSVVDRRANRVPDETAKYRLALRR